MNAYIRLVLVNIDSSTTKVLSVASPFLAIFFSYNVG